jgi:hypothetical protein
MESAVAKMAHHRWFFDEKANIVKLDVLPEIDSNELKLWMGNGSYFSANIGDIQAYL